MKTARSTTNKAQLSRKVSQTVLHAAQITAAAFLTLVLVVGLQAVASATVAFGPGSGPGHFEADTTPDCREGTNLRGETVTLCEDNNNLIWVADPVVPEEDEEASDEDATEESAEESDEESDEDSEESDEASSEDSEESTDESTEEATEESTEEASDEDATEESAEESDEDSEESDEASSEDSEESTDESTEEATEESTEEATEDTPVVEDDSTEEETATGDATEEDETPVVPEEEETSEADDTPETPEATPEDDETTEEDETPVVPEEEETPEPTPDPEPTPLVPFSNLDVNVEQLVLEIFPQGVVSQEFPADPKDNFSPGLTPKFTTPEPPQFSPGNSDATPLELAESGLPIKAIGAAATIMLIVGGAAGAAAAGSGGAGIWGARGGVFALIYRRVIAPFIYRRCDECDVELRYKNGAWVEKGTSFTQGIHNHQHARATAVIGRKML